MAGAQVHLRTLTEDNTPTANAQGISDTSKSKTRGQIEAELYFELAFLDVLGLFVFLVELTGGCREERRVGAKLLGDR